MNMTSVLASARSDALLSLAASPLAESRGRAWRRAAFFAPVLAAAVAGTWLAASATAGEGGLLRPALLGLLALSVLYMALTGWPLLLGAIVHLCGGKLVAAAAPTGASRTALLMPIYNENPRAVFAAMEAMGRAVADAGLAGVDLFILSDTRDEAIAREEEREFERLRAILPIGPAVFYRRRADNRSRKVGNLLDFCDRWGASYDYMVVLDADSLMGASAIGNLIGLMDANPTAGIIQTVPYAVGRETPFARFQQFSARLYTPLLVEGLTFWQGSDGNYWGHNAILRIAPFVAHCALPVLSGREPFGGEILCHDVVEAGLMRAAGWQVWVLPQTMESYEAVPANLVDFTGRERRWCQGNLQHSRLLPDPRLRPTGRFHLAYGIMHYVSAPIAALFLLLATVDGALGGHFAERLLGGSAASAALVALTAALLYGPKLATLAIVAANRAETRGFGGHLRLFASAALEQLGALVITAVLITFYTRFIGALLRGASVRWDAQPRDDRGLSWAEAWDRLRLPTLVGAAWLAGLCLCAPSLLAWASPLLFGLLAAVPAAYASSRIGVGRAVRRAGLFATPEELSPSAVLRTYSRLAQPLEPVLRTRPVASLHLAEAD